MNHKKDFFEWKESTFTEICDNLSDVVCTDRKLNVGDKVIFKNKHGIKFGPFEVLGFCKPDNGGGCVFLDKSSYWFPAPLNSLTIIK